MKLVDVLHPQTTRAWVLRVALYIAAILTGSLAVQILALVLT